MNRRLILVMVGFWGSIAAQAQAEDQSPYRHSFSVESALLTNAASGAADRSRYMGVGMNYGHTFWSGMIFRRGWFLDSIALEGGAFLYRLRNYSTLDDDYVVLPLKVTARYAVALSDLFEVSIYGGALKNLAFAPSGTEGDRSRLSPLLPAFGIGFLYSGGSDWAARIDLGTDLLGVGVSLRM